MKTWFFCGIGGSGMMPLALILAKQGSTVLGSDRARDQGATPDKFASLEKAGIKLFPQDGSGVTGGTLVISTAVEDTIPDVAAAKAKNIPIMKRAELLAQIFNGFETSIAVAGTSGKSTVTGMIATILAETGRDPTVMNGGVILNFGSPMRVGAGNIFVSETDESDGSIALYNPSVAVLNNVTLDHKSLEELDVLFGDFLGRAKIAVLNLDDKKIRALQGRAKKQIGYSLKDAKNIEFLPAGVKFTYEGQPVKLNLPGEHNISNALAALCAAKALEIETKDAVAALQKFKGIKRRMEITGEKNGITVIDDFGHNPDKIAASLKTLKKFPGRLIVMFQPHGYGPLKMMGREIGETFAEYLEKDDLLLMPEAYYAGGTVDRSVTAQDVIRIAAKTRDARWFENRAATLPVILKEAKKGDRVVIMGARDDSLSDFAKEILSKI